MIHALRGRTRYPGLVNVNIAAPIIIDPTSFSDLYAWWKTDAITGLSNNDPITTVPDSSGYSRTLTQSVSGEKPLYKTNVLNGLPVMEFDDTDDGLLSSAAPSNPLTIFIVYKAFVETYTRRAIQGTNNWLIGPYDGTHRYYNGDFITGPTVVANAWVYATVIQTGSSNEFFVNGTTRGTNSQNTTPGTIGLSCEGTYNEPLYGQIAEVVVYSKAMNSTERPQVETYLKTKYVLS